METEYDLKGGFVTTDPRLDRIPEVDPKSFNYPARRGIDTKKPRSYTWTVGKNLDQGREGACVGFGFSHDSLARPVRVGWIENDFARSVYHTAQQLDEWEGGSYPGASPFYEGTSVLAGAKVMQGLGFFKEYQWAFNVPDLILAVGYKGPAVIGVDWYTGMYNTDADDYIHATGDVAGGHCILVNQVSVKKGYFGVFNSWGSDWGNLGRAKISFDDMAILLAANGEACVPVYRRKVAARVTWLLG